MSYRLASTLLILTITAVLLSWVGGIVTSALAIGA